MLRLRSLTFSSCATVGSSIALKESNKWVGTKTKKNEKIFKKTEFETKRMGPSSDLF